ncbi:gluconate 2-dehydrogenase subunit 3 family protein [Ruegeria jejuensis]|uniref:gluconate 2-dehydrogenase subunit 3 family protein n=1 Tax=Ruegeria jejuensis TaxID=3233338 RepID=UPI00355AE602
MSINWTVQQRATLDAILDVLIPANPDKHIPGAGEFGTAEFILMQTAKIASFASAIAALLDRAGELAGNITPNVVRQLESEQPEAFRALLVETYKGYYSRAEIRPLVGVGAHPVHPLGYDVAPESAEDLAALTAPVRARGPLYRRTPNRGGGQSDAP